MKKNVIWINTACVALSLAMMLAMIPAPVEANGHASPPVIHYFTANPSTISSGEWADLSWHVEPADAIIYLETSTSTIHRGAAAVVTMKVNPTKTTTYILRAETWDNDGNVIGTVTRTVTVTVNGAAAPPAASLKDGIESILAKPPSTRGYTGRGIGTPLHQGEVFVAKGNVSGGVGPPYKYYYSWDFGDGKAGKCTAWCEKEGQGNLPPEEHSYDCPGTYRVVKVVQDVNGPGEAYDEWEVQVLSTFMQGSLLNIGATPVAGKYPDDWGDYYVRFTATGVQGSLQPYSYHWDFGDGGEGDVEWKLQENTVEHAYWDVGTYTVTVTVFDSCNSEAQATIVYTVGDGGGVVVPPGATDDTDDWCFIATAAYGTETADELDTLRDFRDGVLMQSAAGRAFVDAYYELSPPLADFIAEREFLRTLVREMALDPMVAILDASQELWND
ncbi:CFI-box-CTERM domain-containing protein [Chloroflexota bacterium]